MSHLFLLGTKIEFIIFSYIFNLAGIVRPAILIDGNVAGWWNMKNRKLTVTMFGNCNTNTVTENAYRLWPDIQKIDFQ